MHRRVKFTAIASGVLLLPSVAGVAASSVQRAAAAGHPAFGTLAASNYGLNAVLTFAPGSTGNVAPLTTITGAATGINGPFGVAFDHSGRIWVTNYNTPSITAYAPNATGNAAPVVTISGSNTTLDEPVGIAVAPNGDIWVANYGSPTVLEFAAGSVGNVAPSRTLSGSATGFSVNSLDSVALSLDGQRVYVPDDGNPPTTPASVRVFSSHANGNASPVRTISGTDTQLGATAGVAVARDGSVWVSDNTNNDLLSYGPHAHGNARPRSVISGSNTQLNSPALLALNPVGEVWAANSVSAALTRFPASADGNVAPDHQIVGSATTLSFPIAVAVYAQPPSTARSVKKHVHHKTLTLRWHKPKSSGGGIEGYQVRRAKHKSGKYHVVKTTTKRSYKKHHARHGFYDVVAFNQAGYGKHSKRVHVT